MLSLEEALVEQFRLSTGVAALLAGRVYPSELPEKPLYPAITYKRVGRAGVHHTEGPSGLAAVTLQLDCWHPRYVEAHRLARAVAEVLDGFKGLLGGSTPVSPCLLEDQDDDFDPELKVHGAVLVFTFWIAER